MNLTEADIQVLASLCEAQSSGQPTDRKTLERRGERFAPYKEDWSSAYPRLLELGLLQGNNDKFELTTTGRPLAEQYHAERPNASWYHYRHFYSLASQSEAHATFCKRVYGKDLCQDGQADMACIDDILCHLDLSSKHRVLDLGCGAGGISWYVAERTGAYVLGIDQSESAIDVAQSRFARKDGLVSYERKDINQLSVSQQRFDAVLAIDSISWVTDHVGVLRNLASMINPGGKMAIIAELRLSEDEDPSQLSAQNIPIIKALTQLGIHYEIVEHTDRLLAFWTEAREAAAALRDAYVREGAEFICDSWIQYADKTFLPLIRANRMGRYLCVAGV